MRYPLPTLLTSFTFALLLSACGGGGGGGDDVDDATTLPGIYVNAVKGSDFDGDGSPERPFRTITMGLQAAASGDVVRVGPGLYDALHGEVFPLEPRPGVAVVGTRNLTITGRPKPLTRVVGGGFWSGDPEGRLHGTFVPDRDTSLTNLLIHNPEVFGPTTGPKPAAILLVEAQVEVDSCVLTNSDKGMRLLPGGRDSLVRNTTFTNNGIGVFVNGSGLGIRFERCTIIDNGTGVMLFTPGVDFGGGASGSEGKNAFVANHTNDFVRFTGTDDTTYARNCFWDVQAPVVSSGPAPIPEDADIWQASGEVDTTGAQKYRSGPVAVPDSVLAP